MTTYPKGAGIPKNLPYGAKHTHVTDVRYPTPSTEPSGLGGNGRGAMPAGGLGESMVAGAMTAPQSSSGPNTGAGKPLKTQPWLSEIRTTKPRPNP